MTREIIHKRSNSHRSLRITHVHLENWRNFTLVDVDIQRRVFLVGANASGKSNFLDVFRFLRDIVSVGGGFREAVRKRGGISRLRSLAARRYSDIVISVHIGDDENKLVWSYELRFNQDNIQRPILKLERVTREGSAILTRPDDVDKTDLERMTQTFLEQVNVNREFRDVANFFMSVRYLHIIPQLIREPNRSVGWRNDPFGSDFLEQIARTQEKTQKARLRRIRDALRVAVPQLSELELFRDNRGAPHLRGKYEHWRPQGAWQTEEDFSDGTLRLMGLFWAALDGSGPLLLEEPELSLHPEVIRFIPQMLVRMHRRSRRQVLISTHSSDLLGDEGIGLDEVLLLEPSTEGTSIKPAKDFAGLKELLDHGVNLAEAVIPHTRPEKVEQLALFEY